MNRDVFKRLSIRTVMLLPFLSSVLHSHGPRECSNETIKGVYGYTITGLSPVPNAAGQFEQLLGVGLRTHDGQGNFTQVQSEKRTSTPAVVDVQGAGTYSVNPD